LLACLPAGDGGGDDGGSIDTLCNATAAYLHESWLFVPRTSDKPPPPKRLAIGLPGGFADDSGEQVIKQHALVNGSAFDVDMGLDVAAPALRALMDDVIAREDATRESAVVAWEASTDLLPSKHYKDLVQLDNGVTISPDPKTWRCAESGFSENLWLNLSTGYIGSGRRNWDGSGGTGAALRHYEETGRQYPLAVKLGTITPDGKADVYSYAEDSLVLDPLLTHHLAHWGIRVGDMIKTDKSMAELEVSLNEAHDWTRIAQDGKDLASVRGPLRVGLENLGNSCYCNATLQSLYALAAWRDAYADIAPPSKEPQGDLGFQLAKLNAAVTKPEAVLRPKVSPRHAKAFETQDFCCPRVLKTLVGQNHVDFSTSEQQDAALYARHLLDLCSRDARVKQRAVDPQSWFEFGIETRQECLQSCTVSYAAHKDTVLELVVPLPPGTMAAGAQAKDSPRPVVSFEACVRATLGGDAIETVEDYFSPVTKQRGMCLKQHKLASLPRFLFVALKRFVALTGWLPTKVDVSVPVPAEFDFKDFVGTGLQAGEILMEDMAPGAHAGPVADPGFVAEIVQMGFSVVAAEKACLATHNRSQEEAVNWIMAHMDDADLNTPAPAPAAATFQANAGFVVQLGDMGFDSAAATLALKETDNNLERAADWLFSRSLEQISALLGAQQQVSAQAPEGAPPADLARTVYKLRAVVSHVGKTTNSGHYVCHVKQDNGTWVFFNDDKVVIAEDPPLDLGYVLLFEQV